MASRDRVAEILEVKRRGRGSLGIEYDLERLRREWDWFPHQPSDAAAFFPIRAVTLLEVFSRDWIAKLVDAGAPYIERGIGLVRNVKLDYDVLCEIQGRTITLGDLVGHAASLNSFGQLMSAFETLLDIKLLDRLPTVVNRWEVEVMHQAPVPIIPSVDAMASALDRLFRTRHILVHEHRKNPAYDVADVPVMLDAAAQFAFATEQVCAHALYGLTPLTNADTMWLRYRWPSLMNDSGTRR